MSVFGAMAFDAYVHRILFERVGSQHRGQHIHEIQRLAVHAPT